MNEIDDTMKKGIVNVVQTYLKSSAFTDRKLTDTPTDALQVVPRKYITNNGPTTNRPTSSVVGQPFLDTSLASGRGKPIWWNGTGWIDATGTYV
jgi:hypothetical protein